MDTVFYIDRQFGHLIFLNVTDGIFMGCEPYDNFNKKLNELYIGKEIALIKIDFEGRMKPSHHNIRHLELTELQYKKTMVEAKKLGLASFVRAEQKNIYTEIQSITVNHYNNEITEFEIQIDEIKKLILEVHGFAV